jgi:hypothetical protein
MPAKAKRQRRRIAHNSALALQAYAKRLEEELKRLGLGRLVIKAALEVLP